MDLVLTDVRCQTRGYVLDGIPCSIEEFQILQRRSIVPFRIIELKTSKEEIICRNEKNQREKAELKKQLEQVRWVANNLEEENEEEAEEEEEEDLDDEGRKKEKATTYLIPIEEDFQATDNEPILDQSSNKTKHFSFFAISKKK